MSQINVDVQYVQDGQTYYTSFPLEVASSLIMKDITDKTGITWPYAYMASGNSRDVYNDKYVYDTSTAPWTQISPEYSTTKEWLGGDNDLGVVICYNDGYFELVNLETGEMISRQYVSLMYSFAADPPQWFRYDNKLMLLNESQLGYAAEEGAGMWTWRIGGSFTAVMYLDVNRAVYLQDISSKHYINEYSLTWEPNLVLASLLYEYSLTDELGITVNGFIVSNFPLKKGLFVGSDGNAYEIDFSGKPYDTIQIGEAPLYRFVPDYSGVSPDGRYALVGSAQNSVKYIYDFMKHEFKGQFPFTTHPFHGEGSRPLMTSKYWIASGHVVEVLEA